jgi:hypothetical protein
MLDAYVDRKIADLDQLVVDPPADCKSENIAKFPTYSRCKESGIFSIEANQVRIPLLVLLVMDRFIHLLPHKALQTPFDLNWGLLEVVGMGSLYLRLLSI